MEKSKTTLRKWFVALFWLVRGANARQLSEAMQVTYKTAWLIAHKIRQAIRLAESGRLLSGDVRVQEGRYGATSFASMFDRNASRHPLIAAASLSPNGDLTRVKLFRVPRIHLWGTIVAKEGFQRFIAQNVVSESNVRVAPGVYNAASHPLSQFWKEAARWMNATYFGLLPKHLQSYLDEYTYRYHASREGLNSRDLLRICASHSAITYAQLIRRTA